MEPQKGGGGGGLGTPGIEQAGGAFFSRKYEVQLGFRVQGSGFRAWGLGFRVRALSVRTEARNVGCDRITVFNS